MHLKPPLFLKCLARMMIHDATHRGWYMDAGATSHLNGDVGTLNIVIDKNNFSSSVLVRDVSLIHVTHVGHSALPVLNPYRTLYLKTF